MLNREDSVKIQQQQQIQIKTQTHQQKNTNQPTTTDRPTIVLGTITGGICLKKAKLAIGNWLLVKAEKETAENKIKECSKRISTLNLHKQRQQAHD